VWALVPAAAGALVYLGSLANSFTLDDVALVRDNPQIRWPIDLPGVLVSPYRPDDAASGLYRPLTILSLAANRALTGPGPFGFHAGNVLLHAAVCGLAWFAARGAGRYYGTALVAALVFAVHPLHSEAVANVAGRAELLAAAGVLAAWLAHRRSRASSAVAPRIAWAVVAGSAYLLATLSKEHAIVAPLLFVADDRTAASGRRSAPASYVAQAAALVVALASRVVALGGLRGTETVTVLDHPAAFAGSAVRWATAAWVQVKYLGLFVWPARLSSDYSLDAIPLVDSPLDPRLWCGVAWLFALPALVVVAWRRSPAVALGASLWLAFSLPTSNLLFATGTVMGERLSYLPSFGACLVLGHLVARLASREHSPLPGRARIAVPVAATVALVLAGSVRTLQRVPAWRDNGSLALSDVRTQPRSAKLQAGAGIALAARGDREGAEAAFRTALAIFPDYAQVHYNLGQLLAGRGAGDEAILHLGRASDIAPDNPLPYKALAPLLERAGRTDEALRAYATGCRLDPLDLPLRFNHGRALLGAGRTPEGSEALARLAREHPSEVPGRLAAALLSEARGQTAEAAAIYRELLARTDLPAGIHDAASRALAAIEAR
jgi:Flp pilus assembly protein TadD